MIPVTSNVSKINIVSLQIDRFSPWQCKELDIEKVSGYPSCVDSVHAAARLLECGGKLVN